MPRGMGRCPPGVMCLSTTTILFGVIIIGLVLWIVYKGQEFPPLRATEAPTQAPTPHPTPINIRVDAGGDDRYTRAPKPERDWMASPDWSAVWNAPTATLPQIATRGIPEKYQSMGVITLSDGEILPLYGRRTASRSDRFQYYTRTDTYNPVQLPVRYKNRDCQDDVGCEELMDGEDVKITASGKEGKATLYRFSGPTYIPAV